MLLFFVNITTLQKGDDTLFKMYDQLFTVNNIAFVFKWIMYNFLNS